MICIDEHIEYLLRRHDCVVVPGWGAFVAQYCDASYDADNECILPPCRAVSFNESIIHNDALLATSVSRRESIGYDAAVAGIDAAVVALRHQLDESGEVAIGRLGIFHKKKGEPMSFQPSEMSMGLDKTFGLGSVKAVDIARREERRRQLIASTSSAHRHGVRSWSGNLLRVAASIVLLIGIGIVLSTPLNVENSPLFASVVSAFDVKTESASVPDAEIIEAQFTGELCIAVPRNNESATQPTISAENLTDDSGIDHSADIISRHISESDPYCLVIASLANRSVAEKFIASSGESEVFILEQDGKFRVCAATGATYAAARDNSVIERYPDAWVCRR